MYAWTYRNSSVVQQTFKQSNLYGFLKSEDGNQVDVPEPFNVSLGVDSPYLKVNRISCNGCSRIKNATQCTKKPKKEANGNFPVNDILLLL